MSHSKKYYAGIGSRQTPSTLYSIIRDIAQTLDKKGYTLRSGAAQGADTFFESGAIKKEIYLPWKGFNCSESDKYNITEEGRELAKKYHPKWDALSEASQKLMIRNGYQVLGYDLKTPVDFILCYTTDGLASGGTGQAIRIANDLGITVFNMHNPRWASEFNIFISMS